MHTHSYSQTHMLLWNEIHFIEAQPLEENWVEKGENLLHKDPKMAV